MQQLRLQLLILILAEATDREMKAVVGTGLRAEKSHAGQSYTRYIYVAFAQVLDQHWVRLLRERSFIELAILTRLCEERCEKRLAKVFLIQLRVLVVTRSIRVVIIFWLHF